MAEDIIRLERRVAAVEQKVSTEQAMRVALLTDITARLDMLEHRAGDAPPVDPASEVPLTREEAEEIAKTCAQAAAALPDAPSYLTTVNMRGWRPHAWVVDAVVNGAYRSRIGQGDTKVALSELSDALKRDQNATCVRIAKIVGLYDDIDGDGDGYDLDGLWGVLEADMAKLRKDASGACDAQRAALEERDQLRDQRDAMRAERDQALARVRELEDSRDALCERVLEVEESGQEQIADLQQRLAKASADTVQAMESAASTAARVQEREAQIRGMHHRLCDATGSNRADRHDVVIGSIAVRLGRLQELELRVASLESMPDSDWWRRQVQGRQTTIDDQTELIARMTADLAAAKERHDQLFAGVQLADKTREDTHRLLMDLRGRVAAALVVRYENDEALVAAIAELKDDRDDMLAGRLASEQISQQRTRELVLALGLDEGVLLAMPRDAAWRSVLEAIAKLQDGPLQADVVRLKEWSGELDDSLYEVCALLGVESHHEVPGAIRALKAESIADVMAQIEKLRGQVANMHASVQWRDSYEQMERALADALGVPVEMFSFSGLIDRVRELAAKVAIGVVHE